MIASTIDGSSVEGTKHLLELLATVSSPDYKAKLQALQDATKKNQDLIALIAPATEIMVIRGALAAEQKSSNDAIRLAGEKASASIADARVTASLIIQDAQGQADVLVAEAKELNAAAKADKAALTKAIADATTAKTKAESAIVGANAKTNEFDAATKAANAELTSYEALKAKLIAKHQAFIESL